MTTSKSFKGTRLFLLISFILPFALYDSLYGQNSFTQKLDSIGLPEREMTIYDYLDDGRLLTYTKVHKDDGTMGNYIDSRREFIYGSDGNLEYDITYNRDSDQSDWYLFYRYEYAYDDFGNIISDVLRFYNDEDQAWEADPAFGYIYTYNDNNLRIAYEMKEGYGNGYFTTGLITYSYYDDGRLEEEQFTTYAWADINTILTEQKKNFTYSDENNGSAMISVREDGTGLFTITGRHDEVYDNDKVIERTRFDLLDNVFVPVRRDQYHYSPQGFYGGFTFENFVDGDWQLDYDNISIFDDLGNRLFTTTSDFIEELNAAQIANHNAMEYDFEQLAESAMMPFFQYLTTNPPISLPTSSTSTFYEDGKPVEIRQYEYYYSEYLVHTTFPELNQEIILYPNPAQDEIRFVLNELASVLEVRILDLNGRMVLRNFISPEKSLDIRSLSKGAYLCVVGYDNKTTIKRFIVD